MDQGCREREKRVSDAPVQICNTSPAGLEPATFGSGGRFRTYTSVTTHRHLAILARKRGLHLTNTSPTPRCHLARRPKIDPSWTQYERHYPQPVHPCQLLAEVT